MSTSNAATFFYQLLCFRCRSKISMLCFLLFNFTLRFSGSEILSTESLGVVVWLPPLTLSAYVFVCRRPIKVSLLWLPSFRFVLCFLSLQSNLKISASVFSLWKFWGCSLCALWLCKPLCLYSGCVSSAHRRQIAVKVVWSDLFIIIKESSCLCLSPNVTVLMRQMRIIRR